MAGRTNSSLGIGITITILSVLAFGLFITAGIFFARYNAVQQRYASDQAENEAFIKASERERDDIRQLLNDAKGARQSLVGYLADGVQTNAQRITGSRRDSLAKVDEKIKAAKADGGPLLSLLQERDNIIARQKDELAKADADRKAALDQALAQANRVGEIERIHGKTIADLNGQIDGYKAEIEKYRLGTDQAKSDMDSKLQASRLAARTLETDLTSKLARAQEENLVLNEQLRALRGERSKETFRGTPEEALTDGSVLAVYGAQNEAVVSVGRKQKAQLGMTFAVYGSPSQIKPDEKSGQYARGKATLEIINVGDDTSTCRITSEVKGSPVVKGDVIANAIYDPRKTYTFVAYGNFDVRGEGVATPAARADLAALIESWGGRVADELGGNVDFLVLGEKAKLPPRPGADAPIEVVQEYLRQQRAIERYDELYRQAQATSVPILNWNRLSTLIGR